MCAKASSTAQPRQGHGLTATSMRIVALASTCNRRSGPLGSLEPGARAIACISPITQRKTKKDPQPLCSSSCR
jgi:hypothetical protein